MSSVPSKAVKLGKITGNSRASSSCCIYFSALVDAEKLNHSVTCPSPPQDPPNRLWAAYKTRDDQHQLESVFFGRKGLMTFQLFEPIVWYLCLGLLRG